MIQEGQWRSQPWELKVRCSGKNYQLDPAADVRQLSVVTAAMRQTVPLETLAVFFLCFPWLLWPPSHPQTLGRHCWEVPPHLQQTLIKKILSPTREASKPAFRSRQMWEERLLSHTLVAVPQSALTLKVKPGVREWDEHWTLLVLQFKAHRQFLWFIVWKWKIMDLLINAWGQSNLCPSPKHPHSL